MMTPAIEQIDVESITIPANRRAVDGETVKALATSIAQIGLRTPITIRSNSDDMAVLVAGAHRLAAVKSLGLVSIDCFVLDCDEDEAELWEISENLHRAELTTMQRADQIARWVELSAKVISRQVAAKPGRPESGTRRAARELNVPEREARRAVKIASLTPEAKRAAISRGLDDNQSALLAAAVVAPERQVEAIHNLADAKARNAAERANVPPVKDWSDKVAEDKRKIMTVWNAICPEAKEWFRDEIDGPIMDGAAA